MFHESSSDSLFRSDNLEKELEQQKDLYSAGYLLAGIATLVTVIYASPFALFGLLPMRWMLERVGKAVKRLKREQRGRVPEERIATTMTEQFKDQGIEVLNRIYIHPEQDLDLFVRFPTKELFAISVMALGEGKVVYNEKNETLCFRKKNSSLDKYDNPDPIKELSEYEWWLRKNRRELFGKSSRDARRRLIKILVFAQPSKIGTHNDHLYATIGDQRFLWIRREKASCYVLSEDQLTNFIKAHLSGT